MKSIQFDGKKHKLIYGTIIKLLQKKIVSETEMTQFSKYSR